MPCWFYEKPDLVNTPSFKDAIDASTEARYRREAARFIIDAGTSQGLRYDTMATGVIFMHRFYMFHSFKEFPRYVTGAACLFLAGKVEETPKKCKDIIRIAKALVPEPHFGSFGDDPKEEIMTHERILLQTIKFDLQVLHPYSYLLKYAKTIKGDKNKIQKLVQMAWTFVNDSLCTTLCLQWEPHIVATAFLYLAGRLSKSDLLDWSGKNSKMKWWDQLTDDVSLEIMEDVCHQLLDLYSSGQSKGGIPGTPPKSLGKKKGTKTPRATSESGKTPTTDEPRAKVAKIEKPREPQPKTAHPVPSAPASQGVPPEVVYIDSRPGPVVVPPPPPKLTLPAEVPPTHPAPPSTSYPVQPSRPAPPTVPPPQPASVAAAPQVTQYYQGTYAPATATTAPTAYATSAPPATYTTVPSQPYPAQPAAPVAQQPPVPQAQPAYPAGQYPPAAPYGTQQYYGQQQQQQQSTYGQQYTQQQPPPPTYSAQPPTVTSQAPVQYASHPPYAAQYSQPAPSPAPQHPPQQSFNPNVPPPGHLQAPPANVPPPHSMPPSHPQQPPVHPPPAHPPPTHAPPNYPPPAPHSHPPPPQNYAPQPPTPGTPTGPPPQPYRYSTPQFQMGQNLGMPRGPPPPTHSRGPPPAPNVSTGLPTVRISSREGAWPGQHVNSTQEAGDDWE